MSLAGTPNSPNPHRWLLLTQTTSGSHDSVPFVESLIRGRTLHSPRL